MTLLATFSFLFGNLSNLKRIIDSLAATDKVSQLEEVLFNTLTAQITQSCETGEEQIHGKIIIRCLQNNRTKVLTELDSLGLAKNVDANSLAFTERVKCVTNVLVVLIVSESDLETAPVAALLTRSFHSFSDKFRDNISSLQGIDLLLQDAREMKSGIDAIQISILLFYG